MLPTFKNFQGKRPHSRRSRALKNHLAAIVFVTLIPTLCVGAAGAWLAIANYQRAYDARLRDGAKGVALLINREIANHLSTLVTLAASPSLDGGADGDLGPFTVHARRAAEAVNSTVALIDSDLYVRLSTDGSQQNNARTSTAAEAARNAFENRQPWISNLVIGAISRRPIIVVTVPVVRSGKVIAVLGTRINPERLSALLATQNLSGDAVATVIDGHNIIVGRSTEAGQFVGKVAPSWYRDVTTRRREGLASGRIITGIPVKLAFQQVSGTPNWTVTVLEPITAYRASWMFPAATLALGGAGALIVALAFAMWLGRQILDPIDSLRQQAEAASQTNRAAPIHLMLPHTRYVGVTEFEELQLAISSASQNLAMSERRHRALAEIGATALWRARPDGSVLESRGWELLTGQTPEQLQGSGWLHAIHEDDVPSTLQIWQQALSEKSAVAVEYRIRTHDGQWLWHRARGVPILDDHGEVGEWFGVVFNIHGRKTAEAELAASEARMRALVDTAPDAIVVMDIRGIVHSYNQGAESVFGHLAAEVIGKNISMLMPSHHAERHDSHLERYALTGTPHIVGAISKVDGLTKDGRVIPLEASIGEWRDSAGMRFFTGVLRDITERRAAEERQTMLAKEVDHRAKNALTVVQSVLRLTKGASVKEYVSAVEARVSALARAHSLLAQEGWTATDLRVVAERELEAHMRIQDSNLSIELDGPPCKLGPLSVQPIAMVLHELATNATKHGALSSPFGKVRLSWRIHGMADELEFSWDEHGGPAVSPPTRKGFGSRVVEATITGQLGGTISWKWQAEGLRCQFSIPRSRAKLILS